MSKFDLNGDGKVDYRDALSLFDFNGDGSVDLKDFLFGVTAVGATAATSAAAGYLAGTALVSATASSIASTLLAAGGSVAGALSGLALGTSTCGMLSITNLGSCVIVKSAVATVVNANIAAGVTSVLTTATVAAEAATGFVAGLPVIQSIATTSLASAGKVIVIGGVPIGITAAIAAGIVTMVVIAGVAYFLRNECEFSREDLETLGTLDG